MTGWRRAAITAFCHKLISSCPQLYPCYFMESSQRNNLYPLALSLPLFLWYSLSHGINFSDPLHQSPPNKIRRNIFLQGPHVGFHANKLMAQKQFGTQRGQWHLASHIAQATGRADEAETEGNNFCDLVTTLLGHCFALYSKSKMRKKDATFPRD